MSVRRRSWTTQRGEARESWVVAYADRDGVRRIETFDRRRDADARQAEIKVRAPPWHPHAHQH
jgi:integrase